MKTIKIGPSMGGTGKATHSALLEKDIAGRATELVGTLSADTGLFGRHRRRLFAQRWDADRMRAGIDFDCR